jgi:hypothetical protein
MGSDAVIYLPSFMKIGSGVQKLIGGQTHTHGQQRDVMCKPILFFQNEESRLKRIFQTLHLDSPGIS